jgi:hypothetical protein
MCGGMEWGGGVVVQSESPRPPRRQHRGGTPFLMSGETSERLQQRDDAAGGWEDSTFHCGGSNGVPAPVAISSRCPSQPVGY